ncbi:SAVED domain-containing protein [Catenulispora rubra]|uniref:SAVED domain-containing protein n=1 Tax=Catenulispora rubra TaxID=280293 RepID=UPI001891FF96|nr:SAVED domain-containing protein [Catenulispora rubra]
MAARAASGARLLGDDVQHLIVWYHVLCILRADTTITHLDVEAADVGNVDDLTMRRADLPAEFWQVKASVGATKTLTQDWLFEKPKGKASLLQRLYASWELLLPRHARPPVIVLATTRAIAPDDLVLGDRATTDARIVETFRGATGTLAVARRQWADHLGIEEDRLMEFLECLKIRHALYEEEWQEKVRDAAAAVGVRGDAASIALGLQQVRSWVKSPRKTFTREELIELIRDLGLSVLAPRALLVVEALEPHPRSSTADYSLSWLDLFDGVCADSRRKFVDQATASARVMSDLEDARRHFWAKGITDIEVDGAMRLPLWFAVGTAFTSTAGFTVATDARDGIWSSAAEPGDRRDLEVGLPDNLGDDACGRPWAVSVSLATDIAEDVDDFIAKEHPDAIHIRTRLPVPGRQAIEGLPHARALIYQLRDELRALDRCLQPPEVYLFLAMPHACALLLGNAWDRMPATTVYWDMGRPGSYAPGLRVRGR